MSTSDTGRPGRYERSFGGLVAALLVTVVAVGGLLWVLGLFRSDLDVERREDEYLRIVGEAQDSGLEPVYPASLPDGWTSTGYRVEPGRTPDFEMNMLTGSDEDFVGIRQQDASAAEMLREHGVEDASPTEIYSARGSVAEAWQGYEDEGGDTAYAAEVGRHTVLVYGSASPEELQDLIGRLTTEPVTD